MKTEAGGFLIHERLPRIVFCLAVGMSVFVLASCGSFGIGGVGWDDEDDVAAARKYPAIESSRISVTTQEVPYQTFKQEFDTVFQDFKYHGAPVGGSLETIKTQIPETSYSVAYENYVLKVFLGDNLIVERKLPRVFYIHAMNSAVIPGKSVADDRILCLTRSRATTALSYILIVDGSGDILFEKVVRGAEEWDILPGESNEVIIGGASTKTVIATRDKGL